MATTITTQPVPNVRAEMRAHRERLREAVHPGVTQREAGFTDAERERLAMGVLASLTERGERWAHWVLVLLAVLLVLGLGATALEHSRTVPPDARQMVGR